LLFKHNNKKITTPISTPDVEKNQRVTDQDNKVAVVKERAQLVDQLEAIHRRVGVHVIEQSPALGVRKRKETHRSFFALNFFLFYENGDETISLFFPLIRKIVMFLQKN